MLNLNATHNLIPTTGLANDNANDNPGRSVCYSPELGETAPLRLFEGRTGYIKWRKADDAAARATFKRLRIRPSIGSTFTVEHGKRAGSVWTSACVTYDAWSKIRDAGLIAIECLLD